MDNIKKQSEFSRMKANDAKMGSYYTDVGHCASIGRFLQFPEDDEVCCLEPSIGNGKAVLAVTGKDMEERSNIKIFGVEINGETYADVSRNKDIHVCLKADFLNDVMISHSSFSFLFMNPPYGTQEDGERYELAFLKKTAPYLSKGVVAVVVVARHMAGQKTFLAEWCSGFVTEHVYRFWDREYEKYQQVVLIGRKKEKYESSREEEQRLHGMVSEKERIPLLPDWIPYFMEAGAGEIKPVETEVYGRRPDWMENIIVYEVSMTEQVLQELVSGGLKEGKSRIASKPQQQLAFDNMDDYFLKYGNSLIDNLEKKLNPLVGLKESVDEIAFLEKRFYPQQSAIVNGLMECMRKESYVFINEDMGCGKTLQGMGVPEGFFVRMMMERTNRSTKDIYLDASAVKYRNIVMCPSHLVKKWEETIKADIPYAKVTIIRSLKELCRLRKRGKERTCREFYIMSKETGKLSYTYMPLPTQVKKKRVTMAVCKDCGEPRPAALPNQCACGCKEWEVEDCGFSAKGMICPECGQLLFGADVKDCSDREKKPLKPADFAMQTKANRTCRHCGVLLWQPACELVNRTLTFKPVRVHKKGWVRTTHWANMAKKNRKTVWVHERWKDEYFQENGVCEEEVTYPKVTGARKFAPSRYIKKFLRGYFDFAVFDEAHEYKGGASAQGLAMHDLIKASRWHLALTGTIAGGYASHFFYLLYRLDHTRMKAMGYSFGAEGERKFVERYGTVATEYEVVQDQNGGYNAMSRGKQIGSPKCRPGISPDIFTHFLLDHAVFLNLSDMSSYLPPLKESVEYIPLEPDIASAYDNVRSLKEGHWFGEINGLKDIQVFAEYPSASRHFAIIPGMEYMGKIYYMNTGERSLKARVFQALTLEGYDSPEQSGEGQ